MPPQKRVREKAVAAEDSGERKQQPSFKPGLRDRPAPDATIAATATPVPSKDYQHGKKEVGNLGSPVSKAKKRLKTTTVVAASTIHDTNDQPSRSYWLMKAEPGTRVEKGKDVKFSIDDLRACKKPAGWDGVRNYGARNNLKSMKKGDLAFFYHSNCREPGIVGIMEIVQEATIDETAFNPEEPYYDPKSSRDNPKWFLVHVEFRRKLERLVGLAELKRYASKELSVLPLLKMGRLSVSAVPVECWEFILSLEKMEEDGS
ncbi:unnamed protein product [Tuber melanosporum]|uniref:Thymocyte nuclear protein 1 n=1 Tax=Tuber melanosporum (strain Mel28) TaxID=656061 RepID=D5GCV0_TUBMM|nr:uncharacterized protein GSTUM_00000758001 [Tuber melanosporum]CAZ82343.1 unnamed protein product [Tuber melanosporum]